jgi:hypothetical protein
MEDAQSDSRSTLPNHSNNPSSESIAQRRASEELPEHQNERHSSRSEGFSVNHPTIGLAEDVHEVIRITPRRRGCPGLETLCVLGCFFLIGILTLMHIFYVGDPSGENGCLPVQSIREAKPELIEIRIVGSFSRLAARLRAELSSAIQKRTDVVTIVLNNEETKQLLKAEGRTVDAEDTLQGPDSIPPTASKGRAGPLAALKRTVAEPWRRVVASVKRVRNSLAAGQDDEAELQEQSDADDAPSADTEPADPRSQDSLFYLPLRMSSTFTASKVPPLLLPPRATSRHPRAHVVTRACRGAIRTRWRALPWWSPRSWVTSTVATPK